MPKRASVDRAFCYVRSLHSIRSPTAGRPSVPTPRHSINDQTMTKVYAENSTFFHYRPKFYVHRYRTVRSTWPISSKLSGYNKSSFYAYHVQMHLRIVRASLVVLAIVAVAGERATAARRALNRFQMIPYRLTPAGHTFYSRERERARGHAVHASE